jgi:oligoendopeptidase F
MKNDKMSSDEISRDKIDKQYKWKLSDLYDSRDSWKEQKKYLEGEIEKIGSFKGRLSQSGKKLFKALDYYSTIEKEFLRLYAYASMLSDQDTRESEPLGLKQELTHLQTRLKSISAFFEPEILTIPEEKISNYIKENSDLEPYRHYLYDILRRKKHTLNQSEERLVAQAGLMAGTAHEIFNILSNADLPYPEVQLVDNTTVRVDPTNYALYRESKYRDDRKKIFEVFFETLQKFHRTFGTQLYGELKKNLFYKNVRNYDSSLHASVDRNNIPVEVFHKLIENVNKNLDTLHRYLHLRGKMLGIKDLHFYDAYPSLTKKVDLTYTYDQAREVIQDSLSGLGEEYNTIINLSFEQNWIDVFPNPGKRTGAYMDGIAYDVHPYILLNYKGKYNDVSTLTHELGHALHSHFSNKNQAYVNSHYPIFLAEVASTVNEALLMDHMLKHINDKNERLALLGNLLDGFRGTLFRQTQFAEFELKIHELTEKGESLTGDRFTELYLEIFKKYYGHKDGVMNIDDLYGVEWAYIPHFYYNFYVFQYSTSFTASQAIVAKFLNGEPGIVDKYLNFLSSGCSDYPIPTLQKVGVDMTGDEPFNLTIKQMNRVMDEIEFIIDNNKNS